MRVIHGMETFGGGGCVVALGTFDGVHMGHASLISEAVRLGKEYHVPSAALTFDRHPLSLIRPESVPEPLTTPEEKQIKLSLLGLDTLIEHPFTPEFAALSPEEFFDLMKTSLNPRAVIVGFNYTFGRKGAGDSGLMTHLCRKAGILCRVMEPVCVGGIPVSSSRIRALLRADSRAEAELLMNGWLKSGLIQDCKKLK